MFGRKYCFPFCLWCHWLYYRTFNGVLLWFMLDLNVYTFHSFSTNVLHKILRWCINVSSCNYWSLIPKCVNFLMPHGLEDEKGFITLYIQAMCVYIQDKLFFVYSRTPFYLLCTSSSYVFWCFIFPLAILLGKDFQVKY